MKQLVGTNYNLQLNLVGTALVPLAELILISREPYYSLKEDAEKPELVKEFDLFTDRFELCKSQVNALIEFLCEIEEELSILEKKSSESSDANVQS